MFRNAAVPAFFLEWCVALKGYTSPRRLIMGRSVGQDPSSIEGGGQELKDCGFRVSRLVPTESTCQKPMADKICRAKLSSFRMMN